MTGTDTYTVHMDRLLIRILRNVQILPKLTTAQSNLITGQTMPTCHS